MSALYLITKSRESNFMIKVMVFGTFDIFHCGHINFLKQAKLYGDYLIVVVARDLTVKKIKGEYSLNKENSRVQKIKKSKLANKVVLGCLGDKYKIISKLKPDIICLGYDQNSFTGPLKDELKKRNLSYIKIIRLKPYKPEIYKSSKLKKQPE